MKTDIVNRIYFEFEPEEALEIYSSLPSRVSEECLLGRFKAELRHWLINNDIISEENE